MKSLITEPIISIEQKHQPQHSIESYHRYFAASNHDHFAQIENDDRRYFILPVSSSYQQNNEYFTELFKAMASDSIIEAFMHVLANIELTSFNPRSAPKTSAHADQRLMSLSRFERYWFHTLEIGSLPAGYLYSEDWHGDTFVRTERLIAEVARIDSSTSRFRPITAQELARELKKLCPSAEPDRENGDGRRGYSLPSLSVARQEFEDAKGFKVDWGEDAVSPGQALPVKTKPSGSRRANEGAGFREFATRTRQFEINL